ncbi:MAG: response regulator [Anaerolineae bacterium]|nr:response regulator [Anaerolineae bacterium]
MTGTLLLVEDDLSVRQSLRVYFEDSGFSVLEANDGLEALELFHKRKPDLVLTDLMMPRLSGIPLITALKSESPDTPIIVVSGKGRLEDAIQAVRQGAWDYVTKPVLDMAALELIVTRALERAQLIQENRAYQQHLEQEIAERTRAEAAEKAQRILAEALRDTAAALNSTLDFEAVLDEILANVERVVQHKTVNISLIDGNVARLVRWRGYDGYTQNDSLRSLRLSIDDIPGLRWMVENRKPLIIPDVTEYPDWHRVAATAWVRSYVGAPIRSGEKIIGFLGLDSPEPNHFQAIHVEGLQSFVDQAALAIENARLYAQAQALAALEERNRIAHDLHDAVSQTLWSASLIADKLPAHWEKDPAAARHNLETLRQLTRGALAEMRALLLELRPNALCEVPLGALLQQLVQAFVGRAGIAVELAVDVDSDQLLPPDVQVALFRMSQEALNNVARHAKATAVSVSLRYNPQSAVIRIHDNGRGFNADAIPPGHLGLGIMRERAASIGATLNIVSENNRGTTIEIIWRDNGMNGANVA